MSSLNVRFHVGIRDQISNRLLGLGAASIIRMNFNVRNYFPIKFSLIKNERYFLKNIFH